MELFIEYIGTIDSGVVTSKRVAKYDTNTLPVTPLSPVCHIPKPKRKQPSLKTMEHWVCDGVARATDGCDVELDGHCEHGYPSWLLHLGYI